MHSLQELQPMILDWAKEKDLLKPENSPSKYLKLIEEELGKTVGETVGAILKSDKEKCKDGVGDILVVLVILNKQIGYSDKINFNGLGVIGSGQNFIFERVILNEKGNGYGYLELFCRLYGYDLTECVNIAWNEIKNRTGKTINGTFIKD